MVGAARFELAAPCSQSRCSTRLSYAPTAVNRVPDLHIRGLAFKAGTTTGGGNAPAAASPSEVRLSLRRCRTILRDNTSGGEMQSPWRGSHDFSLRQV